MWLLILLVLCGCRTAVEGPAEPAALPELTLEEPPVVIGPAEMGATVRMASSAYQLSVLFQASSRATRQPDLDVKVSGEGSYTPPSLDVRLDVSPATDTLAVAAKAGLKTILADVASRDWKPRGRTASGTLFDGPGGWLEVDADGVRRGQLHSSVDERDAKHWLRSRILLRLWRR